MLTYLLDGTGEDGHCRVRLFGDLTEDNVRGLLERLWADPQYRERTSALWDVSACDLPEFTTLMSIAEFVVRHKGGRGPDVIAIVSPAFAEALLARTFRSFERLLKLNLNFCATESSALRWLDERSPAPH